MDNGAANSGGTRECPFCKEEIKAEATRCKHCGSDLGPESPGHGGTCPYCKEDIRPDAIKCKHCGSFVGSEREATPAQAGGCHGCGESVQRVSARQQIGPGFGYDPWCVRSCEIQCAWAGGNRFFCWYVCAWLCSGRFADPGSVVLNAP